MVDRQQLISGVELALAGDWSGAHKIAQMDEDDADFCWFHACLHKIEGDEANARYWYRRCSHAYEAFPDAQQELGVLKAALTY
jgi:hypothetical protein